MKIDKTNGTTYSPCTDPASGIAFLPALLQRDLFRRLATAIQSAARLALVIFRRLRTATDPHRPDLLSPLLNTV